MSGRPGDSAAASSSGVDAPTLVIETPGASPRRVPIVDGMTIGRDPACDVVVDHPTVSRRHAQIVRDFSSPSGWRFEDIPPADVPRSRRGRVAARPSVRRTRDPVALADGTTLRLGRVRAWFFMRRPPASWQPALDEDAADRGTLVRCPKCQHVGWAPAYAAGLAVPCKACGTEIAVVDGTPRAISAPRPDGADAPPICPACRGPISAIQSTHTCPGCGARMHADCYRELGGCATYGCPHVDELRRGRRVR